MQASARLFGELVASRQYLVAIDLLRRLLALAPYDNDVRRRLALAHGGLLRQQVDRWANTWLTAKFSRLLELPAQDPGPFNYPIAVFSEWRGNAFYLNVRYRAPSRRPEDDFVVRHMRMTLSGFGRFDLAYFRHTDKWFTVFRGLTAAECFREIEDNEVFWPAT